MLTLYFYGFVTGLRVCNQFVTGFVTHLYLDFTGCN